MTGGGGRGGAAPAGADRQIDVNVAGETIDSENRVDRGYVERRLDDWGRRLESLYTCIAGWLPSDWSIVDGESLPSQEESMELYDISERWLPSKALLGEHQTVVRLFHRGLWSIGANGRLDLVSSVRHSIIVDRGQSSEQPQWAMMPLRDRLKTQSLTADNFRAVLG